MWNVELYNKIIKEIGNGKVFCGKRMSSKEAVYIALSDEIRMSYETVKSWTRKSSKGPGKNEVLEKVERLLNAKLTIVEVANTKEEKMNRPYTEFEKQTLMRCYEMIAEYLGEGLPEDEEQYAKLCQHVDFLKVGIRKDVFEKITKFIDDKIDPFIYDEEFIRRELYPEEYGYIDENNSYRLRDEESTYNLIGKFMEMSWQLSKDWEQFGMEVMYPILTN